ncbi:MAG: excisionase [Candidatus Thiodiazotropha taylori]|nr:excisionase [Candidatus Thiodiazotropha taylori]
MTLEEWANENYSQPPSINTLRGYARGGRFSPPPQKVGRYIMVQHDAELLPDNIALLPDDVNEENPSDIANKILAELAA